MTDREDFDWCMSRAMQYVEIRDAQGAFSSFVSDINKYPNLKARISAVVSGLGMFEVLNGPQGVKRAMCVWLYLFSQNMGDCNSYSYRPSCNIWKE